MDVGHMNNFFNTQGLGFLWDTRTGQKGGCHGRLVHRSGRGWVLCTLGGMCRQGGENAESPELTACPCAQLETWDSLWK